MEMEQKKLFDFGYENGFIVTKKYDGYSRIYTKTYQNCKMTCQSRIWFYHGMMSNKGNFYIGFVENEYSNDNSKKELNVAFSRVAFSTILSPLNY